MTWLEQTPRWIVWGLALPLLALNGWVVLQILDYFQTLITIVVTAILLSFVLSYPVHWLSRLRLPRGRAVLLVFLLAIAAISILGVTVVPLLLQQLNDLAERLPTWLESGTNQLASFQIWAAERRLPISIPKLLEEFEGELSTQLQNLSGNALSLVPDAIGSLLQLLLTVVLTLYMLLQGEKLWTGLFQWLPEDWRQTRSLIRQNFQNYLIGQVTLGLLMGTAMVIAFLLIRVPFGLLFGIGVGILAIFPFGTPVGIAIVSFLTALKSIWLGVRVLAVAAVLDQLVENAVAPQLLGRFTGLNPVWILISLLIGTKIGGLLGLVLAVPTASSIKSIFESRRAARGLPIEPVDASEPVLEGSPDGILSTS